MSATSPATKKVSARKPDQLWLERGRTLSRQLSHQQFAIGDWLVEGADKWDRVYDAALQIFPDYSKETLRNFAYVARALPTSRRRDVLSWSHHELVAGMKDEKEQKQLLDHAVSKNLSCAGFRRYLHALVNVNRLLSRTSEVLIARN